MKSRRNLPAGVFYHRSMVADDSIVGLRIGDVVVVKLMASPWALVRCDNGHETSKERSRLRRVAAGKEAGTVRCSECTKLAREAVAAE